MSSTTSASRFVSRNTSKAPSQSEANENGVELLPSPAQFLPPRMPLNSIPDPSQCQKEVLESDFDSKEQNEGSKSSRVSDRKLEASAVHHATPKISNRCGKVQSESSSAQSTPARGGARFSLGGVVGACSGSRAIQSSGSRRMTSISGISKGLLVANGENSVEVPHFELEEDTSFWKDHNVQVLIRIRPLSTMERVSQGWGRCLRQDSAQTLVWLGHPETRFTFDHVACETISQEKLFRVAGLPMVENCLSGYNSCMFAYGQTGSGKTYTMMGEIHELEDDLNEDCGITPRVFEYLFRRIRVEEESRKDENLKYSCKCSFLEIYNEQITDLLEPSSTNLQLREDLKKGVYVENLTERNVRTVNDVMILLLQGAANRKMAATNMNSESSRSHSVFTCIIESRWDKDSMTHSRFARLNLVDLAGSERQKSSGAEGDRLKEAANINKSLSTLGLVIMSLVDLAHGKHRHIPYRDSRLTFLLQDSLGGNSKTMIIANVSPSICSVNETLSTLKFAQRGKLIQNNAKVNEDASGDVISLQRQIQRLKGQLSFLLNHHKPSIPMLSFVPSFEESTSHDFSDDNDSSEEVTKLNDCEVQREQRNKIRVMQLEAILVGALRREKVAEHALERSQAEIEQMNHLVCQKEEDAQHARMTLRFREEKITRIESLVDGAISAEDYLLQENKALLVEIHQLQARIDRNPELTRFALENLRLHDRIQVLQNYYENGEREALLAEVSQLRNEILEMLEKKHNVAKRTDNQGDDTLKELAYCREMNSKLIRKVTGLQTELREYSKCSQIASDLVESISIEDERGEEKVPLTKQPCEAAQSNVDCTGNDSLPMHTNDIEKELVDAKLLIEAMESEQVRLIEELQLLQDENSRYKEVQGKEEKLEGKSIVDSDDHLANSDKNQEKILSVAEVQESEKKAFQAKLDKMSKELEEVISLNKQYQENNASQLSHQRQAELIREQVELETSRTIIHLQEEVSALQSEFKGRLCQMTQENTRLRNKLDAKENEMKALCDEWERATLDLTRFLVDGSQYLRDASGQIESIVCSFPQANVWISENVERAARACVEKEETILLLQKSLEEAQKMVVDMEVKLGSLRGATMTMNKIQHLDDDGEIKNEIQLTMLLNEKTNMVQMLEDKLKLKAERISEAEKCAWALFLVIKWLCDADWGVQRNDVRSDASAIQLSTPEMVDVNEVTLQDSGAQVELARSVLLYSLNAVADTERHLASLQNEIGEVSSACIESIQNLVKIIHDLRVNFAELKDIVKLFQLEALTLQSPEPTVLAKLGNECYVLNQISKELADTNDRLMRIKECINTKRSVCGCQLKDEGLVDADTSSTDCSSYDSDASIESSPSRKNLNNFSEICQSRFPEGMTEVNDKEGSMLQSDFCDDSYKCKSHIETASHVPGVTIYLRKEIERTFGNFNKLYLQLTSILNKMHMEDCPRTEGMGENEIPYSAVTLEKAGNGSGSTRAVNGSLKLICDVKVAGGEKTDYASSFFSKFEETRATIEEADYMLNALLKANEDSKRLTGLWKQAGEELMAQRAGLIKEVEQLKSSLHSKEIENQLLQDHIHCTSVEIVASLSLLEECFWQVKRDVEERFNAVFGDILSIRKEMENLTHISRTSLEVVFSEIMEKQFSSFVLYQCHIGGLIQEWPNHRVGTEVQLLYRSDCNSEMISSQRTCTNGQNKTIIIDPTGLHKLKNSKVAEDLEEGNVGQTSDTLIYENFSLKRELERKEIILQGLLFDLTLVQESVSSNKDFKDETEKLILTLGQVRQDLEMKTSQLDDILLQHSKLEDSLADTEKSLVKSNFELEQAKETVNTLTEQNEELSVLLKDLYSKKSEIEEQLEEQKEIAKGLEEEILQLTFDAEKKALTSVQDIGNDLERMTMERDQLLVEIHSLTNKLEMAVALADENEAIAVEARQGSKANKVFAEQKEEEVKVLEHSVEELECTINVLEKKVCEMEEEVERYQRKKDSYEVELQSLRERLSTVEKLNGKFDMQITNVEQANGRVSWWQNGQVLELHEAHNFIRLLEEEKEEQAKEIKRCKDYISELILHAEAQASQYQQKYKSLEFMLCELKREVVTSTSTAAASDKSEKSSVRTRGSSSPFRCISSLVQQMNLEKDQEILTARLRIEEIEGLAASRQKEICMLNTRLAAAESMTHDIIRDLLGVKLDMTNYANLIDQHQVQRLMEEAHQQTEEFLAKEQEIHSLRNQIDGLIEERKSCITEINRREADLLAAQVTVEQLRERDQLLSAQNEMLKMDKSNLKRSVIELDEMVKTLLGSQSEHQQQIQQTSGKKLEHGSLKLGVDLSRRLSHSEKLISRVNDELHQYRNFNGSHQHGKNNKHAWK